MSKKTYILWGSRGHAKVLADIIYDKGGKIIAIFDNDRKILSSLKDVPIFYGISGFNRWSANISNLNNILGLVAIGGDKGEDRLKIHNFFKNNKIFIPTISHSTSFKSPSVKIGEGSQILAFANIASECEIGDSCIINHHASIDHECKIGDGTHVAPGAILCGNIHVGKNVFIGAGATILPNIKIGSNCTIGAGAIITKNISENTIAYGNPLKLKQNRF